MPIFKGAGVAIVTPMKENLEVDYDALETNINYQIDNGTDAIVIAGTTGESATLSEEEHKKVVKAAVEFTKHRVPVIAGTGSNSTQTAIELSQEADADGAESLRPGAGALVHLAVAVLDVAQHRLAQIGQMGTDLVGAAGFEVEFEVGENGAVREGAVMGYGALAGGKVDGALDEGAVEAGDRGVDGAGCSGFAEGEGLIRAVDFAGAHGLGENGGA